MSKEQANRINTIIRVALLALVLAVICFSLDKLDLFDGEVQHETQEELAVTDVPQETALQASAAQTSYFDTVQGDADAIVESLSGVPEGDQVVGFSLLDQQETPTLGETELAALNQAIDAVGSEVAFLLIDAQTGEGIQYNSTEALYAASSSKAWFSLYLLQLAEMGEISLDDSVPYAYADNPLNQAGTWENDYCVGALIENTILYSDNSAYECLREAYEWYGYEELLERWSLEPVEYSERAWYPDLSPVISVQMWIHIYFYLGLPGDNAQLLESYLANTEVSFLREALEGTGQEVLVLDKAGWDNGGGYYNAICDSGVVQMNGHTYFVSVLCQTPQGNDEVVEDLMVALFDAAATL